MPARRHLAVGTAVLASLLVLTGCEQPTPLVSLVSGGTFAKTEAASFCFDGQDPTREPGTEGGCRFVERPPTLLEMRPGDQLGIDVDKELAESGWVAVVRPQNGGQQAQEQASPVQESHYFTFVPQFESGPIELDIRSLSSPRDDARVTGVWKFVLAPKD
jgi:hypothetical protein